MSLREEIRAEVDTAVRNIFSAPKVMPVSMMLQATKTVLRSLNPATPADNRAALVQLAALSLAILETEELKP